VQAPRRMVLLVDDDAAMRMLQRRILEPAGYAVAEASGAHEALTLLKRGVSPELVIADLQMPGVPGEELVRRIRRLRPDQRVLYVTANGNRLLNVTSGQGELLLDKPFTSRGLLQAVSRLVDAAGSPSAGPPPTVAHRYLAPLPARAADPHRDAAPARVLVVDDLPANHDLVRRLLPAQEFEVDAVSSAEEALLSVQANPPDVLLLDVRMPGRDGFDLCRQLKSGDSTRLIPIVLVTADSAPRDRLRAFEAGADEYVAKPFSPPELRARLRALSRLKRYTDEVENAEQVIVSLALTIEARDAYSQGRGARLSAYATALGEALNLDAEELRALHRGAYLHDIGKIGIPDAILAKAGPLTPAELDIMQTHPVVGERLCGSLRSLARVRPIVRHHHERLDGSGYPDGLRGSEIPLLAEIMGLVDAYDALTTERPYRPALPLDRAAEEIQQEVRKGWRRKELADLLLDLVEAHTIKPPSVPDPDEAPPREHAAARR